MLLLIFLILFIESEASSATSLKFNASLTEPNEFPWIVRLVSYSVKNDSNTRIRGPCTGALIARQWVLTTARCVMAQPGNQVANSARIHLGKYDLNNGIEAGEEFLLAREFYVHPDYNPSISIYDKDFALIKLPRPVAVTRQVQPITLPNKTAICLSNYRETSYIVDGCIGGLTVGWPLSTLTKQRFLHKMELDIQEFRTCKRALTRHENSSIIVDAAHFTRGKLCAGRIDRQHACLVANPGAPFICRSTANRDRVLLGLFLDDVRDLANLTFDSLMDCEQAPRAWPSIFGRVCSILDWIHSFNMADMGSPQLVYRPSDNPVRLTGDPAGNGTRGYVEFYYNNTWGTVCGRNFNTNSARVVCQQLEISSNFPRILSAARKSSLSKPASIRPIWLENVLCDGSESNLAACQHKPFGTSDCRDIENVVVDCNNKIGPALVYDPKNTQILEGTFRLFGGPSNNTGFLEVWYGSRWGAVCDDLFSQALTSVACRHLGFGQVRGERLWEEDIRLLGIQRSGTTQVWLEGVSCTGSEQNLLACQHSDWGVTNCHHNQGVAIKCSNETVSLNSSRIGAIRLHGGRSDNFGIVEISINREWGTVCSGSFGVEAARVVCRMLRFSENNARVLNSDTLPNLSSLPRIWLDNVLCQGNETTLLQCRHRPLGEVNCNHIDSVAVHCQPHNVTVTPSSIFTNGQVRLVGSNSNGFGILEVFYANQWGTVCNDGFNDEAARVACRQLGFNSSRSTIMLPSNFNSSLAFQIWIDDISCKGTEDSIYQCQHSSWGEHNCGHSEDVALNCLGGIYGTLSNDPGTNGQVRLVGSSSANASSGFVEIYWTSHAGRGWGSVCDDDFEIESAKVVCRQLGFNPEYAQLLSSTEKLTRGNSTAMWLDDVYCSGDEQSLVDCTHNEWGIHNCLLTENVGISCSLTDANRPRDNFIRMTTTQQGPVEPGMPGDIRLTGGDNATIGYVEFYWNGRWGTICDDGFTKSAAQVVCRQLKLSSEFAQIVFSSGLVPSRYRQIWLDDIVCSGAETRLSDCTHNGYGVHNCDASENVVVSCSAERFRTTTIRTPSSLTSPRQGTSMTMQSGVEGQVRLTGSSDPGTGFVEIYWHGFWGTVCYDLFGVASAHVVCRQLGYTDVTEAHVLPLQNGLAQSAASVMWLDKVICKGNEQNIASCSKHGWGSHSCDMNRCVSITCNGRAIPISTTVSPNPFNQNERFTAQLVEAVLGNQVDIVGSLLIRGASANVITQTCCAFSDVPVLTCAACSGYVRIASLLIANGADLEARDSGPSGTALIWAARAGFLDMVRLLIISGTSIEATTHASGDTALTIAASAGKFEVVRYLVNSGADITVKQFSGMTAAQLAWSNRFHDIAKYLDSLVPKTLENVNGSRIHPILQASLNTRMFIAIEAGFADQVEALLQQGASSRARTLTCCSTYVNATALICAACTGNLRTCQVLVGKNADINEQAYLGITPLLAASRSGNVSIVNYLLQKGAIVDARSASMVTPLMWAANNGNLDIVVSLVEAGADINLTNSLDDNAMSIAYSKGYTDIVTYLTERGGFKAFEEAYEESYEEAYEDS